MCKLCVCFLRIFLRTRGTFTTQMCEVVRSSWLAPFFCYSFIKLPQVLCPTVTRKLFSTCRYKSIEVLSIVRHSYGRSTSINLKECRYIFSCLRSLFGHLCEGNELQCFALWFVGVLCFEGLWEVSWARRRHQFSLLWSWRASFLTFSLTQCVASQDTYPDFSL